jgi:putative ABC transport system permease protein
VRLALAELRAHLGRFLGTVAGLVLLFTVVLGMGGIYRGMVADATFLIDSAGDALWLTEEGRRGPFAEASRLPDAIVERARVTPGVTDAVGFRTLTYQFRHQGRELRVTFLSERFPEGGPLRLAPAQGRGLQRARGEIVLDQALRIPLGARLTFADEPFEVVGLLKGGVSSGGDPIALLSEADLERILQTLPAADRGVSGVTEAWSPLAAVVVHAATPQAREQLARIPGVSVWSAGEQRTLLLEGAIDKARRQIGLFRALLVLVSTVLLSLVVFAMTSAKSRELALVKLLGARHRTLIAWVVGQAITMTLAAYGLAVALGFRVFPLFPRRVVLSTQELWAGVLLALLLSLIASAAAVRRALAIPAAEALGG